MNCVERLLRALRFEETDRVPATGLMTSVTVDLMELCGVSWPEAHFDSEKMATLAAAAYEHYGLESLKLPFDMLVETEALGGKVDFGNLDTLPQARDHLYDDPADLASAVDRSLFAKARFPTVLSAIAIAKKRYGGIIPVVSSIVGPFTLGAKLFGFENFLTWMVLEPETLAYALESTTDLCAMYAKEQVAAGCDVVQIGEASCSGDLISGESYGRHIAPFHKELCAQISVPSVVHICGNITGHLKYIADTGMSGISMDEKTDVNEAVRLLKGNTAVIGYVPTLEVLLNGTAREVTEKSLECIKTGVNVLNAGCAWPARVSGENIVAMVLAARNART